MQTIGQTELTIVCAMLFFNVMFIGFYETVLKQVLGGHKDQSYQKKILYLKRVLKAFGIFISLKKAGYRQIRMFLQNVLQPTVDIIFF